MREYAWVRVRGVSTVCEIFLSIALFMHIQYSHNNHICVVHAIFCTFYSYQVNNAPKLVLALATAQAANGITGQVA